MGNADGARRARECLRLKRSTPELLDEYNRKMYSKNYSLHLTEEQESLIYGTLLGDGNIHYHANTINPLLQINHSLKQRDYVMYKYSILSNLCNSPPIDVKIKSLKCDKNYYGFRFQTRTFSDKKFGMFKTHL